MKIQFNDISVSHADKVLAALLAAIQHNNIIVFEGPMGSGKTTFIKTLCKAVGVIETVNSPTYSLVNEYKSNEGKTIYHFDFYRLNSLEEAFDMGAEEYLNSGNLCLIEWADRIVEILPEHYLKLTIAYSGEERNYSIEQI